MKTSRFSGCAISVFDGGSLEILLNFINNISELIISIFPLLANDFQFWNKPFFKSLALLRIYFAKMKHFMSSYFSFPQDCR